jgi:hypothetical protein
MHVRLHNGFRHPPQPFITDDEVDVMVAEAAGRSAVVQGVRTVRFASGVLEVEFEDSRWTRWAQGYTGWPKCGVHTLCPFLKLRDGIPPAVIIDGVAYGDYTVEADEI